MLTPQFLTKDIARTATIQTLSLIKQMSPILSREACHIVILVPSMIDDRLSMTDYPDYPIKPHLLYEYSLNTKSWNHKFDMIARCKALQLWHGRNDDRTDCMPHLLFSRDTPYWGGVKRHEIVVACSGFQPHFDKMFSGIIADTCIGLAYNSWTKYKKTLEGDFI